MGEHNWSEVERLYAEAAQLERAGGAESERQAIYERLQARLRPIAISMARDLVGDARRAEQIVEATLKYLPLLIAQYAPTGATCAQWFGKTLIAFAYNAVLGKDAPLSRDPLSLPETRTLTDGEYQLIEWLLQTLTLDEFTVYYECVINGLSAAEVAAADGFEEAEVERLLLQAKQKVRDAFASEAGRRALTQALGMDLKWLGAPHPSDHSSAAYSVANNGAVAGTAFVEERRLREEGGEERVYLACAFRWQDGTLVSLGVLGEGGEPRCLITPEGDRIVVSADGACIVSKMLGERGVHAFLWTQEAGVEDLNELFTPWLNRHSMLECAYGVSPNGCYIVGEGYCAERERKEAFLLDLGAPSREN